MNALDFLLMWADKRRAEKHRWRVAERTLLLVAALGGSLGGLLGMYIFHHKTKHPKFYITMPLLLLLHAAITAALIYLGLLK